jgi:AcrR family transcriptional regulator
MFVLKPKATSTRNRLLRAAAILFAERGFRGTTMREIAARARVNLAAANYHYGSKKALYLAVLRAEFAKVRSLLARRGGSRSPEELATLSAPQVAEVLRARASVMLDLVVGTPPSLHATLMQREMSDPTEALPTIVEEFIGPMLDELQLIVHCLQPALDRKTVERCAYSIVGQVLFYQFARPALLRITGVDVYPASWPRELAAHISGFTIGGIDRLVARSRMKTHVA